MSEHTFNEGDIVLVPAPTFRYPYLHATVVSVSRDDCWGDDLLLDRFGDRWSVNAGSAHPHDPAACHGDPLCDVQELAA